MNVHALDVRRRRGPRRGGPRRDSMPWRWMVAGDRAVWEEGEEGVWEEEGVFHEEQHCCKCKNEFVEKTKNKRL